MFAKVHDGWSMPERRCARRPKCWWRPRFSVPLRPLPRGRTLGPVKAARPTSFWCSWTTLATATSGRTAGRCRLPLSTRWRTRETSSPTFTPIRCAEAKRYAWGGDLTPRGQWRRNKWQGSFPTHISKPDDCLTTPVKSYRPNGFGLRRVAGNVWEWCNDWFSPDCYEHSPAGDPRSILRSATHHARWLAPMPRATPRTATATESLRDRPTPRTPPRATSAFAVRPTPEGSVHGYRLYETDRISSLAWRYGAKRAERQFCRQRWTFSRGAPVCRRCRSRNCPSRESPVTPASAR